LCLCSATVFDVYYKLINGVRVVSFLHAGDFTPVCTTELGKMAAHAPEFAKRGVKLLGLSCDDVSSHAEWVKDIEAYTVRISPSKRSLLIWVIGRYSVEHVRDFLGIWMYCLCSTCTYIFFYQ
jgi:peroxiredoxin